MSYETEMSYKVTFTSKEWDAIEKVATENVNRFASWIADDYQNPDRQRWLESVKERYELWKDIQNALINRCDVEDAN